MSKLPRPETTATERHANYAKMLLLDNIRSSENQLTLWFDSEDSVVSYHSRLIIRRILEGRATSDERQITFKNGLLHSEFALWAFVVGDFHPELAGANAVEEFSAKIQELRGLAFDAHGWYRKDKSSTGWQFLPLPVWEDVYESYKGNSYNDLSLSVASLSRAVRLATSLRLSRDRASKTASAEARPVTNNFLVQAEAALRMMQDPWTKHLREFDASYMEQYAASPEDVKAACAVSSEHHYLRKQICESLGVPKDFLPEPAKDPRALELSASMEQRTADVLLAFDLSDRHDSKYNVQSWPKNEIRGHTVFSVTVDEANFFDKARVESNHDVTHQRWSSMVNPYKRSTPDYLRYEIAHVVHKALTRSQNPHEGYYVTIPHEDVAGTSLPGDAVGPVNTVLAQVQLEAPNLHSCVLLRYLLTDDLKLYATRRTCRRSDLDSLILWAAKTMEKAHTSTPDV